MKSPAATAAERAAAIAGRASSFGTAQAAQAMARLRAEGVVELSLDEAAELMGEQIARGFVMGWAARGEETATEIANARLPGKRVKRSK